MNEKQGLDRCVGFTQSPTNQTSTENVPTKTQASVKIRDHFIRCPSLQTRWWRYCQIALDSKFNASIWSVNGVLCFMIVVDKLCSRESLVDEQNVAQNVKARQKSLEGQLHLHCWALFASAITGAAGMEVTPLLQDSFSGWEGLLGTSFFGRGTYNGKSN